MKFAVYCRPSTDNILLDAMTNPIELIIEAPSACIADAKALNYTMHNEALHNFQLYPAKPVDNGDNIFTVIRNSSKKPYFIFFGGVFLYLYTCWNFSSLESFLYAIGTMIVVFYISPLCNFFIGHYTGDNENKEHVRWLEREYSRREGYRQGWNDFNNKQKPLIDEWTEADNRDITVKVLHNHKGFPPDF